MLNAQDGVTTQKGVLRVCCSDRANLEAERVSVDLVVRTCRVCGRHHYELTADPGRIGVEGVAL